MAEINEGLFYTLSQITIALAGFSAVAIGLVAQNNRDWGVFEKANAWCIFAFAVLTFLASIIPVVLIEAGVSVSAALMIGFTVPAIGALPIAYVGIKVTHDLLTSEELRTRIVRTFLGRIIVFGARFWAVIGIVLVWLAMFDFLVPRTEAVYVGVILFGIILSLVHFAFFIGLSIQAGSEEAD